MAYAEMKAQIEKLEQTAQEIPKTGVAKFIIVGGKIYWGNANDFHRVIAEKLGIPFEKITGGGMARPFAKIVMSSNSFQFGPYNRDEVQRLLPDWEVEEPAPWKGYK